MTSGFWLHSLPFPLCQFLLLFRQPHTLSQVMYFLNSSCANLFENITSLNKNTFVKSNPMQLFYLSFYSFFQFSFRSFFNPALHCEICATFYVLQIQYCIFYTQTFTKYTLTKFKTRNITRCNNHDDLLSIGFVLKISLISFFIDIITSIILST